MKKLKILLSFLLCFCLSVQLFAFSAGAEEESRILQAYFSGETLNVFTTGISAASEITAKIGNSDAVITNDASYIYGKMDVYTTILIDNSKSMPDSMVESVYALLDSIIEAAGANDYYRIISFDTDYKILCEFTNDRYVLSKHSRSFDFDGDSSTVYNTIFETIPEMVPGELPRYYRTLVITDGTDKTKHGVTYEELYDKLSETHYTVDVVSVTSEKETSQNKNLASIARKSCGSYMNLYPGVSVKSIAKGVEAAQTLRWIEINGNKSDYDGATRQVTLKIQNSDVYVDIKFPLIDYSGSESTLPEEEEEEDLPAEQETEDNLTLYIIIAAACVVVAGGLIVALIIILNHNKKDNKRTDKRAERPVNNSSIQTDYLPQVDNNRTEYIDSGSGSGSVTVTFYLEPDNKRIGSASIPEGGEIIFGRAAECNIVLDKGSVSRRQFSVFKRNNMLYVRNMSHSNITALNGITLSQESVLRSGDRLTCGRETITVKFDSEISTVLIHV